MNSKFEAKMARFNLIDEVTSGHSAVIYSLATSPNGEYIASASDDCTIKIWRNGNYEKSNNDDETKDKSENQLYFPSFVLDKTLIGHSDFVRSVKYGFLNNQHNTDLFIVSGGYDKTLKMWNAETGECRWTGRHPNIVYGIGISTPRNNNVQTLIASVGHDKAIKIWNAEGNNQDVKPIKTIKNAYNSDWIYNVSFCSTNQSEKVIVIGSEQTMSKSYEIVKIFDVETSNRSVVMKTRHKSLEYPCNVFTSPCNKYAISNAFGDDKIIIHDVRTGELAHEISNSRGIDLKLIGNNYLLSASDDGIVKIINYKTNQCIQTFTNPASSFSSIASDPYNNYIVCAEESTYKFKLFREYQENKA